MATKKPVSPTGAPRIPAAWVPYLMLVAAVSAGLTAAYAMPEGTPIGVRIAVGLPAALAVLGIASPGWRKGTLAVVLGLAVLGNTACATVRAAGDTAAQVAKECAPDVLAAVLPKFLDALLAGGDWRAVLAEVKGSAAACVMDEAIAELERRTLRNAVTPTIAMGGATADWGAGPDPTPMQLERAREWRAEHSD